MSNERPNQPSLPVTSDNSTSNTSINQPREPRTLSGLLAYSLQARAQADEQQQNAEFRALSEENKAWLAEALSSMSVNVIEELSKAIQIIQASSNLTDADDPTECEQALDVITDFVDNMDISNDFYKIGGFAIFSPLLHSPHPTLRARAANLIAEVTQNNPFCQEKIVELLPRLLEMVKCDHVAEVRVKALYALSCSIREHPPSLQHFMQHSGFSVLLCAMQSGVDKLKIKASFLLSSLCSQSNDVRDHLYDMGMVEQLAALLYQEGEPHEHLLSVLLALCREHTKCQAECRRPELRLRNSVSKRMEEARKEDNLEQMQYCNELQQLVFGEVQEVQDR